MSSIASISVVVPILNEEHNIPLLYKQVKSVLDTLGRPYEMIFVDDGSTDASTDLLFELAQVDNHVKVIQFRKNYGQTAAMRAGLQAAVYDIVITMDGDLQNDPNDIPLFVETLENGYDLVHGWRKDRKDSFLNRRLPSILANWLISKVTGFPIHDLGCTLKAMRSNVAQELELYGDLHRFLPLLAHQRGASCIEVVCRHHPRRHGKTKYGIGRTLHVVLDLLTVKYLLDFFDNPMRLFGRFALISFFLAAGAGLMTLLMKIFSAVDMTGNPLLLLSVGSAIASVQFISIGLLAEVNSRIYYDRQRKAYYAIRRTANLRSVEQ